MKTLVFGKVGQVGTELQRRGDVIALDYDVADFCKPETCIAAIDKHAPDVVINAVAYTAVDKAEEEEDLATVINGHTPGLIAQACAARKIPLVHISTDYVFAGGGEKAWLETDKAEPKNVYGRSKLLGERLVAEAAGVHAIIRTAWVFSAHGNNFVKTMLRIGKGKDQLNIVDDQIGGPTPAAAIADVCLQIGSQLIKEPQKTGLYHFSGAPDVSWKTFAGEIFSKAGYDLKVNGIPTSQYPTPASRPANSRLDCQAIFQTFAINRPNWCQGLDDVLFDLAADEKNN
jgi:dTDP-4-dehydrorhamnose reductase